ncbi:molybdate ABC transporter ATP-binding protein ModF [Vibrio sp. TH_r3]|uniref:molybdate ABC transporter ATP-binding protein ModF n=1 Tax=Vibrio sp. TH_r3 TaxID=3082084 RepID=UPI00295539A7|nr:molybdate ABC transporter ATP-binding protein ModF [Vibrio sp. TH_r3]MDV7104494.1 molybdate ABC transporter ATP-binding protein ModF [Vibrio sp. TH_r3]
MEITFRQVTRQTTSTMLEIKDWHISQHQSWGIFSTEGDIGSILGDLLCQEQQVDHGEIIGLTKNIAQISLTEQQRLLESELAIDDTDFMDKIDTGSTVYSLIYQQCNDDNLTNTLIEELDLTHLSHSGFRVLSTGETRRLMLARVLACQPNLLILDEPYAGLDTLHRNNLARYLANLAQSIQLIVVVSREDEMPEWVDNIALFDNGKLIDTMPRSSWNNHPIIAQLAAQSEVQSEKVMALIHKHKHIFKFDNPLFELTDGKVAYTDTIIFSQVNWRINNGEHWQIRGPNGCGKSTLLGLIFGDHPQCYSNNIQIFGKQRGSGETIWDIKKNIGMVSSSLHLQYRASCSALDVVLSGFYDSIGLYTQPSKKEIDIAKEWLDILHMEKFIKTPFKQLEYGQQRLLLVARALVKQPALLILDEPYQGLDNLGRRLVMKTLDMIAKENLSQLLYVSHYEQDTLDNVKNFVDFVTNENSNGYKVVIHSSQ